MSVRSWPGRNITHEDRSSRRRRRDGRVYSAAIWRAPGEDVVLVDVSQAAVDAIDRDGLAIEEKDGSTATIRVKASSKPEDVGPVDLIVNFVKCYHTEAAIAAAKPMLGEDTAILTLQNGWGNADRIAAVAGKPRVMVGVTYHSGTLLGPGRVKHSGIGMTYVGELDGAQSRRLEAAVAAFRKAGIETTPSSRIIDEIWKKLALNVCTLPTSALLRFQAHELIQHEGTMALMRGLLAEVVAVAKAQGISLDHTRALAGDRQPAQAGDRRARLHAAGCGSEPANGD